MSTARDVQREVVLLAQTLLVSAHDVRYDAREVQPRGAQREVAVLPAGHVEQVLSDRGQAICGALDAAQRTLEQSLVQTVTGLGQQQHLDVQLQAGQRSTKLVRRHRQERVPRSQRVARLGVQPGAVDRQRTAPGECLRERQAWPALRRRQPGRCERHGPDRAVSGDQGNAHD